MTVLALLCLLGGLYVCTVQTALLPPPGDSLSGANPTIAAFIVTALVPRLVGFLKYKKYFCYEEEQGYLLRCKFL
jgi:hypothetical protein